MNKVFMAGRLANDPIQHVTQSGITQSKINIACADRWNKNEVYFFPCIAWKSTANFINTYLKKGDAVVINGRLMRRSYLNKEGKKVYIIDIVIETIQPFVNKKTENDEYSIPQEGINNISVDNNTPEWKEEDIQQLIRQFEGEGFEIK